ncbi:Nif3-like dinuclear metal center hexameric protein [Pullulanibacillus sp. KACC 23026]|uniref:Nif3-like dinuclear metal center hexameric protein n=1 Tax=Pullulanibacillus sp. KACC 23026 TaxID=3028315 RepID=UPI0023B059E8|nr:Nif3-like dinuclear metal center hexameric protein [Pullulanibacillus sp. KACC 23026]WEG14250.1 Nif3-like dinuclear metal center hexameric protein [Pullulanibacillus sp. KACC 23026]
MTVLDGQALIHYFEQHVPKSLAVEGDRIGLQIGTLNKPVSRVMVTLDVLENVVDEAIQKQVDLIIAHHPVIYRPLKTMRTDQGQSKIVAKCIQHNITVYVAHTNLDIAEGGLNDWLADALKLQDVQVLSPTYTEPLYKLVVFVPKTHETRVREAIGEAGAGFIGNYSHCTFNAAGVGTFRPGEGAMPYIGRIGELERVEEVRIETIVPEGQWQQVKEAMLAAHPYEEVAYDQYELKNQGKVLGLGRVGALNTPMTLKALAQHLKALFKLEGVRVVGDLSREIKTVAVLGGDGNHYIHEASAKGADCFITGDLYYHTAHDAILDKLSVIDVGHHVESIMKQGVKDLLTPFIKNGQYETEILISEAPTNPFQFL